MERPGCFHVFIALAILLKLQVSSGDDGNVTDTSNTSVTSNTSDPSDPSDQIVRSMQGQASYSSCAELQLAGRRSSGIYMIQLLSKEVEVYCDLETESGGWTVFQRRDEGTPSLDFYREWSYYKTGFGDRDWEFWLGLDNIHALVSMAPSSLRVELEDFDGQKRIAKYSRFYIKDEANNYRLSVAGYSGDAGDSLAYSNRQQFSTFDRDNDDWSSINCAARNSGAWWYKSCTQSNLNGKYRRGYQSSKIDGVNWYTWRGSEYSLKKTEMKIRPTDFLSYWSP